MREEQERFYRDQQLQQRNMEQQINLQRSINDDAVESDGDDSDEGDEAPRSLSSNSPLDAYQQEKPPTKK